LSTLTEKTKSFKKTAKEHEAIRLLKGEALSILLYGGSRSGKTFMLLYAIIVRALKHKSRHLVLRLHFNHVKTSVWHDTLPKVIELACPHLSVKWNRSDYYVEFPNGSEIWIGGLDDKSRTEKVLGTEYSTIFFNECSQLTYDSTQTALSRLAENSGLVNKAYYDCNPPNKKHWLHEMFLDGIEPEEKQPYEHPEQYASLLMNPIDNKENLPDGYIETILGGLSRRKRERFLLGLWRSSVEGALWSEDDILRLSQPPVMDRIVIGVDPATTSGEKSDETGIIVAGKSGDRFIVLEDLSDRYSPNAWANKVIEAYDEWQADCVVAEVNNGGDMVEATLRTADKNVSYQKVWATRKKAVRAEPIEALYEQKRCFHCGVFPELEDQMCSWEQGKTKKEMGFSPDRMDAMVWAATALMIKKGKKKARAF